MMPLGPERYYPLTVSHFLFKPLKERPLLDGWQIVLWKVNLLGKDHKKIVVPSLFLCLLLDLNQ